MKKNEKEEHEELDERYGRTRIRGTRDSEKNMYRKKEMEGWKLEQSEGMKSMAELGRCRTSSGSEASSPLLELFTSKAW